MNHGKNRPRSGDRGRRAAPIPGPQGVYLDANGSTPVHPAVADLAHNLGLEVPGNAAAEHPAGHAARDALARAREQLAAWLGAAP